MRPVQESSADVVVVGTGAGGATAAKVFTDAGLEVVLLEEGPRINRGAQPRALLDAMAGAFRNMGSQATARVPPIVFLQGCVVGGSTAINSGIIWRMPEDVRRDWETRFGLHDLVSDAVLDQAFDTLDRDLGVAPVARELLGGNGLLMEKAAMAMGLPGEVISRNAPGCKGSARCLQGCPNHARQSMDVSYVPQAESRGARVLPLHRAQRVVLKRGRAQGVEGTVLDRVTRRVCGRFRIHARRAVVVSAGTIHSPLLLAQSGVRHGLLGRRLQSHPGCAVVGRFTHPVGMGTGATQTYEVPQRSRGYKLESLSLPPELLTVRIPGVGAAWRERTQDLSRYAQWCVQARMEAQGRVRGRLGSPRITYTPTPRDVARSTEALGVLCEMMFAAGAEEVYPGVSGVPPIVRSVDEARALKGAPLRAGDFHFLASHLFGTVCACTDPRHGVVNGELRCHETDNLYVMDGSVFPTNMGVNPQHSIMAVSMLAAQRAAERLRSTE